ncbi:MAG: DHHA1 domain-containing protein, partial [Leptolyngbyaceae cyanobacterium bins.302]|nr:DHHA1 domain-containing protein [Leptolyngbyaceae cyanobacterium bins.302]
LTVKSNQFPTSSPNPNPQPPILPSPLLPPTPLAKGSARSINKIDLYQLVQGQEHLLYRFGGHPFAAGLSLPVENIPLFTEAINQQLRQQTGETVAPAIVADLSVTVRDLGKELFQELKLLEPCGIGNPVPRLLLQNCWFANVRNKKIKDRRGQKIEYIKTEFEIWDDSCKSGFPGIWWGHYRDDFPKERCDAIVELDFNTYDRRYEVRIVALRLHEELAIEETGITDSWILDWREAEETRSRGARERGSKEFPSPLILRTPPASWTELRLWLRRARQEQRSVAIAFHPPASIAPMDIWQRLVGIAKYLSRTEKSATRQQFLDKLEIGDLALQQGFKSLTQLGFELKSSDAGIHIRRAVAPPDTTNPALEDAVQQFLLVVKEEQFHRQYFAQLSLSSILAIVGDAGGEGMGDRE